MDPGELRRLLESVRAGETGVDGALERLRSLPYEDMGFARPDYHRHLRTGSPEVVFCPGKTTEQIVAIVGRLRLRAPKVLATRAGSEAADAVCAAFPGTTFHAAARMLAVPGEVARSEEAPSGVVLVVTAGTADIPVAEEAAVTAGELGSPVDRLFDVGVSGLHRLLDRQQQLHDANVLVVVAGMEGALASVVGGLVSRPVVAVPTSIGYGASFGGVSALLTMLNSCAAGVAVVNIDNGFGAGYLAHTINRPGRT